MRQGAANWWLDVQAAGQPWPFDAAEIRVPIHIIHGGSDGLAPLPVLRRSLARAARVQERIYPGGETLTGLGFAGALGWAGVDISLAGGWVEVAYIAAR